MLGMRRQEGVPESTLCSERLAPRLNQLLADRLVERKRERIRLTRNGLLLADLVCAELAKDM